MALILLLQLIPMGLNHQYKMSVVATSIQNYRLIMQACMNYRMAAGNH